MPVQFKNQALAQGVFLQPAWLRPVCWLSWSRLYSFWPVYLSLCPLVILVRRYDLKAGLLAVIIFCVLRLTLPG